MRNLEKKIKKYVLPLVFLTGCTKIAFVSYRDGGWGEIYRMNSNGSREVRQTYHPAHDVHPSWGPKGKWLFFQSSRYDENFEICKMRKDGSKVKRLTRNLFHDVQPSK